MKHEIDIFSEIVDSIRDRYDILSYSHIGTTYVFTTDNLGDMLVDDYIEILGIDCLVTAIDSNLLQFTIVSQSDLETAQWWKAKKPYFDYEKILGESNTLLEKTNSAIYRLQKYPLIFLPLDIEQERDVDSAIQIQLKNVIFYILTSTENNNQYANWRLTNIFKTILIPIYEKFFEAIKISPYIYDKNNLINHLYIENYLQSDNNNNIFNEYTDAIQLRFSNISLINLSSSCDKFAIAPLPYIVFSYSNFSAVYADDVDYNDIISCSLTATNNSAIAQNCIINFKTGKYIVQVQQTIAANSSVVFECTFENIDIFQENIVTVFNSANQLIDSVTLVATPQFEMYFEATEQKPQFYIMLMSWIPGNYIVYDDGTSEEISVGYSTYHYKTFAPGMHLIYFSNSKEIRNFRWLTNSETFLNPQIYITNQFWKLSNLQYLYLYHTSSLWFENITILPNELLRMKKIDTLSVRNIRNCPLKIYYPETLGGLQFSQITNPQIENNFFQKLSNVSNIQAYLNASLFSITLPELLFFTKITVAVIFVYFNCPNISRDSNLGSGYAYNFQNSKLTSQACDNLIYVIRNTNNYTGTYAKYLILNGSSNARRTHASDDDKAYLLSKGWVVTANEPL